MAKIITPLDAHTIMNLIASEANGSTALSVVDSSSFVSVGESVLNTGIENTINALTMVIGKTMVSVRPYSAKITLIQEENTGLYTSRVRKISFYDKGSKEAGWVNTDTHSKNLYEGYDNGTNGGNAVGSMWEQDKPVSIQFNFGGSNVFDFCLTTYEDQLKAAFRDENEFVAFWNGVVVAKQNEMEQMKEAKNRLTLCNYMAGLYDLSSVMAGSAIDLVAAFNTRFGTTYTGADLRGAHLKEFLAFMVATIKEYSEFMAERTASYHWNPSVTRDGVVYDKIIRHTPKEAQKLFLYEPLILEAKSLVMPEIFNEQGLLLSNYEGVTYWQAQSNRPALDYTPAIPDVSDPSEQTVGTRVQIPYVVGVLFDTDACVTNFQFDRAESSPLEARKLYRNTWFHSMFNSINDFTQNGVLFYMAS